MLEPKIISQSPTWRTAVHASQDVVEVDNTGKGWLRRKSFISRKPVKSENIVELAGMQEDDRFSGEGKIVFTTVFRLKDKRWVYLVSVWNMNTQEWKGKQFRAWNFETLSKKIPMHVIASLKLEHLL